MANNETTKTKIVDFVPEFGIDGDFKKIVEYGFLEYNSLIMPVINLLYMDEGSNSLIPTMGLRDTIVQFPFSDPTEADSLIAKMNQEFNKWCTVSTTALIDEGASNWSSGEIVIKIDITGIPAPIKVSVDKDSSKARTFKIVPPNSFR